MAAEAVVVSVATSRRRAGDRGEEQDVRHDRGLDGQQALVEFLVLYFSVAQR